MNVSQKVAECSDDGLCNVKFGGNVFNKRLDVEVAHVQLRGPVQELWNQCSTCRLRDHLSEVVSEVVVDNGYWLGLLPKVFIVVFLIFYLSKVRGFLLLTQG